jgi:hypothetical protein
MIGRLILSLSGGKKVDELRALVVPETWLRALVPNAKGFMKIRTLLSRRKPNGFPRFLSSP